MTDKMRLYGYTLPDTASLKIAKPAQGNRAGGAGYHVRKQSNLNELVGGGAQPRARGQLPPSSALAA